MIGPIKVFHRVIISLPKESEGSPEGTALLISAARALEVWDWVHDNRLRMIGAMAPNDPGLALELIDLFGLDRAELRAHLDAHLATHTHEPDEGLS